MEQFRYKTVIFDMDGTILDTLEDLTDAVNFTMKNFHMPTYSIDDIRSFLGNGIRVLLEKTVPGGSSNEKFDEALTYFKEYYGIHCNDKTKAYPGIKELMHKLKAHGIKIAIVSNKVHSAVCDLSEKYFDGLSDISLGEQSKMAKKPAPDMVFEAMRLLGASKETTVYIGDSEVDFATAKNSGLDCISVLWGFRTKTELLAAGATVFAEKPEDIFELIKQLAK